MARKHIAIPTRKEVEENPALAYSDHVPILASIKIDKTSVPVLSYNVLGPNFSGIHPIEHKELPQVSKARYLRMCKGIRECIEQQKIGIMLFQETNDLFFEALQTELGEEWEIIEANGLINCFKKEDFQLRGNVFDGNIRMNSMILYSKKTKKTLEIHNTWGFHDNFPDNIEDQYRKKLNETKCDISLVMGDTNSRIAPVSELKVNIITTIVPAKLNDNYGMPPEAEIGDNPDGAFVLRKKGRVINQVITEVLDLATGNTVYDNQIEERIDYLPLFRMFMCLDKSYERKKIINNQTIFDYQKSLRHELNDEVLVRMASDCYNNKAIAIRFPKESPHAKYINNKLPEGFQFKYIEKLCDGGPPYPCIFAPAEKAEQLHRLCLEAMTANPTINYVRDNLNAQIKKLQQSRLFLRADEHKVKCLIDLRNELLRLSLDSSASVVLDCIHQWENKIVNDEENKKALNYHRNVFFSPKRDKKTSSSQLLEAIVHELEERVKLKEHVDKQEHN